MTGESAVAELRRAVGQLFGAERRLRGRDHGRAGELTIAQIRSIAALGREREMTAGQLARSAELNPATVTAMLDQLEAAGIVERQRSTTDRRVCNVSLTEQGWQILDRKLADWHTRWQAQLAEFTDTEIATAVRIIDSLTEMYDSLALEPSHGAGED